MLGLAVPIYFIVMTSLHHEVHTVVVSELQLRERNDEANARLREANARLSKQALRDDLTGLPNRAAFGDQLERAVAAARRDGTIDRRVVLRHRPLQVRQRLARSRAPATCCSSRSRAGCSRSCARHDMLARLGGDEFTMLLDRLHDGAEA